MENLFELKNETLVVTLPEGKTASQLVTQASEELRDVTAFHGLELKITGRITTGMCLVLGHKLSHVCKSISILDPKEGVFIECVSH